MSSNNGKLLQKLSLYSDEAIALLQQSLDYARAQEDVAKSNFQTVHRSTGVVLPRYEDSSDDDNEERRAGGDSDASSASSEDDSNDESRQQEDINGNDEITAALEVVPEPLMQPTRRPQRRLEKPTMDAKQTQAAIIRHVENLSCVTLQCNKTTALHVPSSLLSKNDRLSNSRLVMAGTFNNLASSLNQGDSCIVILCVRSGRFAGAVYQRNKCLTHTSSQRYTVRKGQGKAQSTQDGNRRPKSMGAQLRRAGEQLLKQDIHNTLAQWRNYIQQAALILISSPKTMLKDILDGDILSKTDHRIRRVPLDVGRPTFEAVGIIHSVLTTVTLRECTLSEEQEMEMGNVDNGVLAETSGILVGETLPDDSETKQPSIPLTPLHVAARDGNLETLTTLMQAEQAVDWIDMPAGEFLMTPLHFAAQADTIYNTDAVVGAAHADSGERILDNAASHADCVYTILVNGRANPCLVDARHRVPWFLAANDKVREAFRKARAALGEEYCEWDAGAKVAAALTEEDVLRKQEAEAEKRRKKRARQKQKKAEEKAIEHARAQQQREQAERLKQEEDAKRIRDGLQPKATTANNVCDFCQTAKKGLKRSSMFKRLDYVYCSTDCVEKHKRELMAAAAMKRFGG